MAAFGNFRGQFGVVLYPNIYQEESCLNAVVVKGIQNIFGMFRAPTGIEADGDGLPFGCDLVDGQQARPDATAPSSWLP